MFHMGFGFGMMNSLFPIFFFLIFGLIVVVFIVVVAKGAAEWSRNNRSPMLTVDASVVSKRTNVSRHSNGAGNGHHTSTSYYVTFQVDSGDRMELRVSGREYGLLAEGDEGKLTFQGTRYQGFIRNI